jgi:4-alpha-glucanotransferase
MAATPARRDEYEQWVAARPDVLDYARFRARVEGGGEPAPHGAVPYHAYVQWLVASQLESLARNLYERDQELYLDLPIGAHPEGYDVAAETGLFARGASVGAPPDRFFADGQDWGFPPIAPGASRATAHRYLRECVDAHLRYARRLRVDHVIGFHRLWWVPPGATPTEGAYVSYPADEQYAALMIAAARAGGRIVGENLGTVPPAANRALRRHGLLGMYVLPFEIDEERWVPRREPGARELACLGTHDTATFAVWWRDLPAAARAALAEWLAEQGETAGQDEAAEVERALLAYLGTTEAEVVLATLEDLWLEVEAQNVPGTTTEHPNFRRRAAKALPEIASSPAVGAAFDALDRARTGVKR